MTTPIDHQVATCNNKKIAGNNDTPTVADSSRGDRFNTTNQVVIPAKHKLIGTKTAQIPTQCDRENSAILLSSSMVVYLHKLTPNFTEIY